MNAEREMWETVKSKLEKCRGEGWRENGEIGKTTGEEVLLIPEDKTDISTAWASVPKPSKTSFAYE